MQKPTARLGARPRFLGNHPRVRKLLWWLVGSVAFIAVAGFIIAPPIVKWQAEKQLAALLDRAVAIESVSINPFALSARVAGFRVSERDGTGALLGFDTLFARLSYRTFVRFAPVVAEAKLERPFLNLARTPAKAYNFQDLVDKFSADSKAKAPEPEKDPARFSLNNLQLLDGKIAFDDQAEKQEHAVTDINITVPFVSNFDADVAVFVQPRLEAVVNGDPVRITGETKPFDDSRETRIALNLSDVDLARYLDYSPVPLAFTLSSGKLDAALSATFRQTGKQQAKLVVTGNAMVREFSLVETGGGPVLGFHQLGVVVNSLDVFGGKADVARIGLESPALDLRREKDGTLSLARLIPKFPARAESRTNEKAGAPFAYSVGEIAITSGSVAIADLAPEKPFRRKLEKLEVRVRGLASAEDSRASVEIGFDSVATGSAAASPVAARVDYAGEIQLGARKVGGKLQILQLNLGDLYPYYEAAINAEVVRGTADVSAAFDIAIQDAAPTGRVTGMAATFSDLHLRLPGSGTPFVEIGSASLENGEADFATRRAILGKVTLDRPAFAINLEADGTLNATRLLKTAPVEAARSETVPAETSRSKPVPAEAPQSVPATEPWIVTLNQLELERGRVNFEDRTVKPSVTVALQDMNLTGAQLSTAEDSRGDVAFRTTVNRTGSVSLRGKLARDFSGTLAIVASKIALVPFKPYLAPYVKADLAGGEVSTRGSLTLKPGKELAAAYKGDFEVSGLALRNDKGGEDLLTWKSLRLAGIDAASEPLRVGIDQITLADFFARLVLDASGQLNLRELAQDTPKDAAPPAQARAAPAPTDAKPQTAQTSPPGAPDAVGWLRVGGVRLQNGSVDFSDFFVKPNYRADLSELNGSISTLTPDTPGDVELTGKLNQKASLDIRGRINPLAADLTLNIQAKATDIELPRLSPYTSKYLGYGIDRGKLSVKVKYVLADRKLVAENNLYLDQLKLGEKVASPDAADLPVQLAVALLQDRKGVIDVNLPISGSLDDPQFSISGIVMQVIGNIITKAVTAPFALLGSVAGAEGDLDYLEFDPGSAQLSSGAEQKLDMLGKALFDRPGIKLDVTGQADAATDRAGLRRAALDRAVKQSKLDALRGQGAAPKSAADVTVDAKEYPELLKRVYGDANIPDKPTNALGFAKDIPVSEMEKLLLANASVSDDELRDLATRRAQAAKDYLTGPAKISTERIFLTAPKLATASAKERVKPTRVEFALR